MKIRIQNQSIRFRLSLEEVRTLEQKGTIQSEISFSSVLTFSIQTGSKDVRFDENRLVVNIPAEWILDWENNDLVGFEFDHKGTVNVIVEKDYACAHTKEGKALFGKPKKMN